MAAPIASDENRRIHVFDLFLYVVACMAIAWNGCRVLRAVDPNGSLTSVDRTVQIASAVVLIAIGIHAWRSRRCTTLHTVAIGIIAGLTFYARIYGFELLDPTNIGWVLRGDWGAHYGGWEMYRHAPWTWPLGSTPTLMYPLGTSVVYTDSLPLVAMLLKPASAVLPASFQYVGLWFALCCMLQGAFGALLAFARSRSLSVIFLATNFFVFAPVFIQRTNHITLMSQWLLLAAIWLYFRMGSFRSLHAEAWPWWLLAAVAALTTPYFVAMIFAIHAAYWFRRVYIDRERTIVQWIAVSGVAIALTFLLWFVSGGLMLGLSSGASAVPYGVFSFNLFGFFNSDGFSRIVPKIAIGSGQYEGFAYLGLGVFLLLAVATMRALLLPRRNTWRTHWPLIVAAIVTALFAASSVLLAGQHVLLDWPIDTPLLATFRSSGRFIWIAYYLIVLGAIWATLSMRRNYLSAMILFVAFALQAWELDLAHVSVARLRTGQGLPAADVPLRDARWDTLADGRHHLTLIPPLMCGVQPGTSYLPFLLLAAKHSMTLNSGYVARWDAQEAKRYCEQLVEYLSKDERSGDDLYVVADDWLSRFDLHDRPAHCERLDNVRACVVDPTERK
ncbi:MAG TPA: DUF6311 domain-containing protein [Rudaea sp.]|nr:DUF6311 domain-containing protein [Rudaea sp.]